MRTKKNIKRYLLELPYISTSQFTFDLEFEKLKTQRDLEEYLRRLFAGEIFVDKYGNEIQLNSRLRRNLFKNFLETDPIVAYFLLAFPKFDLQKFLSTIKF